MSPARHLHALNNRDWLRPHTEHPTSTHLNARTIDIVSVALPFHDQNESWLSRDPTDPYTSVNYVAAQGAMPTPDPNLPCTMLDLLSTLVVGEYLLVACTLPVRASADGMQNIIWAFTHTAPGSLDEDTRISIHWRYGRAMLNLTFILASLEDISRADQDHTSAGV
ncbi:hypothetical protein F5148DRAFT_789175 [Russula earlei]|uniref:Uncharacterized protein n=1 Tax=Russula earlei TaxID=71964 RepID=A0ACC0TSM8_9AGAM|nr:hypothetical protein F5148DRAFT_789175 [Russula earlei]